jgi:hypothetical protein
MIYGIHHDSIAGYDPYQHIVNNQIRYNNTGVLCATLGPAGEFTCAGKLIATDCFYLINPQSLGQSKPTVIQCYNDRDEYEFRANTAGQLQLNMVSRGSGTEEDPLPDYSTGTFFNIWADGRDANSTTWEKMLFGYAAFAGDPDPPSVRRFAFASQNSTDTNVLPIEISAGDIGSNHLVVTNTGDIGIGTFAPGYKLDVSGTLGCLSATIDSYTLNEVVTPQRLQISVDATTLVLGFNTSASEGLMTYSGTLGGWGMAGYVAVTGYISTTEYINIPETTSTTVGVISRGGAPFIMAPQGTASDRLNTFIGTDVGNTTLTGYSNYCVGESCMQSITSGYSNVAMGYRAASSLTEGDNNVFLGREAGFKVSTGVSNFALGFFSLAEVTTGSGNVAIGAQSAQYITGVAASDNICIGRLSGKIGNSGVGNIFIGRSSGFAGGAAPNGSYNICLGYYAGYNLTGWHTGRLCIGAYNQGGSEATDTIIYGQMQDNSPSTQTLALNAVTTVSQTFITTNGRKKKTSRYTTTQAIPLTDNVVYLDTDSAGFTATLPAGENGQELRIINVGSSGNTAVIAPNGTDNIYGANSNVNLYDSEAIILTYETTEGWW